MTMFDFLSHRREPAAEIEAGRLTVREMMTSPVVTVEATTPVQDIARILDQRSISAVPVVDVTGAPIGIVSDGDLIGRSEEDRQARRSWWLTYLGGGKARGGEPTPDDAAVRVARDIMSTPVITVTPDNHVGEVAQLFTVHRIKRAPVVDGGRIVGIISRADLVRAILMESGELPATRRPDAAPPAPLPQELAAALDAAPEEVNEVTE